MPGVAIRRAVSLLRCTRFMELLLYVLLVDFQCVAQAGQLVHTTTGPTKELRVTTDTDVPGVKVELNISGRVLNICRQCRRDFFRPKVADRRKLSKCNRCQPCTVCAYDERVTAPCTRIQDTKCTPLCGEDFYFDRVSRNCQRKVVIKHEIFVEESTDVVTHGPNSQTTVLTDRVTNQPSERFKTFGRANQGSHSSSSVVDAESDEQSPVYMTSLFASGAAGIAVLVLMVFASVYVVLRIKQWWNYKMAFEDRGPCNCTLLLCCVHCRHENGSRSSSHIEAGYSLTGNRNVALQHGHQRVRRPPIGIKVTRIKAPAESKSSPGMDSKENQEGSGDELERNRQAGAELSRLNKQEHGIEQTARTPCEAASQVSDQFEIPTVLGVETVM